MIGLTPEQNAWMKDLRSGRYAQGQQAFRTPLGFCCLGLHANILNPDGWEKRDRGYWRWYYPHSIENDHTYTIGSFNTHNPLITLVEDARCIEFNDNLGLSFRQIADELTHLFNTGEFAE